MSADPATRHVPDVGRLAAGEPADVSFLRAQRGKPVLLLHSFASDAGNREQFPLYAVRFRQHAAARPFNDLGVLAACQAGAFDVSRLSAVTAPTLVIVGEQHGLAGARYLVAAFFVASGRSWRASMTPLRLPTKNFALERSLTSRVMPRRSSHRRVQHDGDEVADLRRPACSVWQVRPCDSASARRNETGVRLGRYGAGEWRAGCRSTDACHLRAHPIRPRGGERRLT